MTRPLIPAFTEEGLLYLFAPPESSLSDGTPFGSSFGVMQGATLTAQFLSTNNPLRRTGTFTNDFVIGAGNGYFHSIYNNPASYNVVKITGGVSGTGAVTLYGGYLTLSGSNSYTGDTRLGTLNTNLLTLDNVDALAGSTLDMNAADSGSLAVANSGTFYRVGGLKGSRDLVQSSQPNAALEIGTNGQSTTFSGNLGQSFGNGYDGVVKSGTGTLTFTGTFFTSDTPVVADPGMSITGGVLTVESDSALGVTASSNTLNTVAMTIDGGTLRQTTAFTVGRPIEIGSTGATLDTAGVGASATPAFNGIVSGTGSLVIAANGDLNGTATGATSLGGVNTFVGTTTITSGMVQASASFGNAANQVVLDGGGLLATGGSRTNSYATRMAQAAGRLRAAAAGDVLNQGAW
ncbi:MAG: hypothetical protein FJ275_13925 [Planctomycetes bacterium]|nr:hypothetical protein [Planctomycetota bacterium]MBM4059313.1 hypothetical protein [Planctomycetota bacterium]